LRLALRRTRPKIERLGFLDAETLYVFQRGLGCWNGFVRFFIHGGAPAASGRDAASIVRFWGVILRKSDLLDGWGEGAGFGGERLVGIRGSHPSKTAKDGAPPETSQ
jgi:hypothetical protein